MECHLTGTKAANDSFACFPQNTNTIIICSTYGNGSQPNLVIKRDI